MRSNLFLVSFCAIASISTIGCLKTPRYADCNIEVLTDTTSDGSPEATTTVTYDGDHHLSTKVTETAQVIGDQVIPVVLTSTYEYNAGYFPTKVTTKTVVA